MNAILLSAGGVEGRVESSVGTVVDLWVGGGEGGLGRGCCCVLMDNGWMRVLYAFQKHWMVEPWVEACQI